MGSDNLGRIQRPSVRIGMPAVGRILCKANFCFPPITAIGSTTWPIHRERLKRVVSSLSAFERLIRHYGH